MRAASAAQRTGPAHDAHGFGRHLLEMGLAMIGIPPREDVIRAVDVWLDEAELLARMA
jgi:hypothetical protein